MPVKTTPIPTTALPLGETTFGPFSFPANDTSVDVVIDRTIANGLNATPAAQFTFSWYMSTDGGKTWIFQGGGGDQGGIEFDENNNLVTQFELAVGPLTHATSRNVKLVVNITGSGFSVAGVATFS